MPAHGVCDGDSDGVGDDDSEMHWHKPSTAAPQLVEQHTVPAHPEMLGDTVLDELMLAVGDRQMQSKLDGAPQDVLQQKVPAHPVVEGEALGDALGDGDALGEALGVSERHWQE